jgi:hypothetical protein
MSYLRFEFVGTSKSELTKVWSIMPSGLAVGQLGALGHVAWYAPWRKYCFCHVCLTAIFDPGCLREIVDFCETQTKEHNERRNVRTTVA